MPSPIGATGAHFGLIESAGARIRAPRVIVVSRAIGAAIGAAMTRSWREIPHYHVGCEIVVEEPLRALESFNRDRPVNERVLFAAVLLRAVAQAASDTPTLNGRF